jgi:hypothetical protein
LIEEKVKSKDCVNKAYIKYESFWLPKTNQYIELYDAKIKSIKASHPDQGTKEVRFTAVHGKPKIIALVEKKWTCGATNLDFLEGINEADINQQLEKSKKLHGNITSYRIVKAINTDEELTKIGR